MSHHAGACNVLLQCFIVRSSRHSADERPLASDASVVRLVRLANPLADTPETVIKCIVESGNNSGGNNNSSLSGKYTTSEPFLQPLAEFLSQAEINYITFGNTPGNSALLLAQARKNRSPSPSGSQQQRGTSREGLVEVAVYPAFTDGAADMNSGGKLKLRSPLLEQLEQRTGVPLLSKPGAAAIVQLCIVMAWEAPQLRRVNVTLQSRGGGSSPTNKNASSSAAFETAGTPAPTEQRQRGGSTVVSFSDAAGASSKAKQKPAGAAVPSLTDASHFGDTDALAFAGEDDHDEDGNEHAHGSAERELRFYDLPKVGRSGGGGGSPKTMSEAKARRLEMLRRENIARREQQRLEREAQARAHAEQWEQQRAERRQRERDLAHQAERARGRHEAREDELLRKRSAYDGRERDLEAERREFQRRLEEGRTLAQIEALKRQGLKEAAAWRSQPAPGAATASTTATVSGSAAAAAAQPALRRGATSVEADPIAPPKEQQQTATTLSSRLEQDMDGEVTSAVRRSNLAPTLDALEQQREKQLRDAADAANLELRVQKLHADKAKTASSVRRKLLEYEEAMKLLRR